MNNLYQIISLDSLQVDQQVYEGQIKLAQNLQLLQVSFTENKHKFFQYSQQGAKFYRVSVKEMAEKAFTGVQCPVDNSKAEGIIRGVIYCSVQKQGKQQNVGQWLRQSSAWKGKQRMTNFTTCNYEC